MPNKLEQLAQKKRQEAADAREKEIRELASVIADETLSRIKTLSADHKKPLEASVSELAVSIAEAVAMSNTKLSETVELSLTKLVDKVRTTIPIEVDNSANAALFTRVAEALVSFDRTVGSLKLDPTINFDGATEADIKKHIDRLIKALPDVAKSSVKIEYEKVAATSYINVRLTDGISFYKALGGGGGGGGAPTPTIETDDGIGVPVVNPDGTPAGVAPKYSKLIDEESVTDVTFIGLAKLTGAEIPEDQPVWQISRIDETGAVTKIQFADGETDFTKVWDNRDSLDYF